LELLERDNALAVGAPEPLVQPLRRRVGVLASIAVSDSDALRSVLADLVPVEAVLGPAFYGYADRETFVPVESDARVLTAEDEPAYERFRASVPDTEWNQGGLEFEPSETVGLFVGEDLVAVAAYDLWDDVLAHLGVITHPNYRGEGYGRAVVSRATDYALADGYLPQYRTLDAWPWSVALARGLGFKRFATSMLISFDVGELGESNEP
jgi:GNAT superfamily N-acetyltransferase